MSDVGEVLLRAYGYGLKPDFIVVRAAPDLPAGVLPPGVDGRWYDRATMPVRRELFEDDPPSEVVAVATGRFEVRDDGAVAEVFEVRP